MADELNNDGTGATAAPDTGGTNPQSTPDNSSQLDPKGASDSGTSPQGDEKTAQQHPFPSSTSAQNGPQSPQNAPQGAADLSKSVEGIPNTPPPPAVQQAIQQGGWTHQVLKALAGGDQTQTTIDPNTGKVQRSVVPMSNARLGMSVALAALTGAFNGLAQKGPGAEGRSAAQGFDLALQQKQQQQKEQDEEASKTYARQAAIAQTNLTQHETAQRMGMLDYDFHQKIVAGNQPSIAALDAAGAVQDRGVREQDLLSKYHITKDMAIVDGTVARMDSTTGEQATDKYGQKLWDNTYTVVDPSKKIALSPEMAQNLADHHVAGYFTTVDGKAVPKQMQGSAPLKASLYLNGVAQSNAIDTTEAQLGQQFARLGDEGKVEGKQFAASLTKALDKNQISPKDLTTFSKYASMPFDQALDQMRKDKVDPQTIGNISSLVPADVQKAMAKQRLDQENQDNAVRKATAAHVEAQASLPDKLREEEMKKKIDSRFAATNAYNEEAGRIQAKNKFGEGGGAVNHEMVNNPKLATIALDPNDHPVNGVRQGYLSQLKGVDPALAAEVQAVGEGRLVQSKYGLAKGDGQRLAGIVAQAYPGYDQAKGEAYGKLRDNFTAGPQAVMSTNGRTTLQHMARLYDTAGQLEAGNPLSITHSDFVSDSGRAIDEMNSAYTKGVLHKDDRAKLEDNATSIRPEKRQEFAKEGLRLLGDKIGQVQTQWGYGKPSNAVSDFPLLDQDSIDAYNHVLHGERAIDEYGRVSFVAGTMKAKDGTDYYVDKNKQPLYPTKDTY